MRAFAERARARGAKVEHREFARSDHGFTHVRPVETARAAITMIGRHLRAAYDAPERHFLLERPPRTRPGLSFCAGRA
ncbi:hypothetical protein [Nonomuraea salmonea]|uniref:hypothetical protein n=1 Tax=Nonomuraea salmonea TaxID=46181 RepID=UPI002FE91B40